MRVITLDNHDFISRCRELEQKCGSYKPDLIISIATGGDYVAEQMFEAVRHTSVVLRRPTSESKDPHTCLFSILKKLPRPILNFLRITESYLLQFKANKTLRKVQFSDEQRGIIVKAQRILVIDDAVDSGSTLESVILAVSTEKPDNCEIKSAVITVTTARPAISPDFYLFHDKTLIRFPWSKDMK